MIGLALDVVLLVVLLKTMSEDDDFDLARAGVIAVFTAVGTLVLATVFAIKLGLVGVILAVAIVGGLMGMALWASFRIQAQQAAAISVVFMVAHISIGLCLSAMMR